jgi:CrcB protein
MTLWRVVTAVSAGGAAGAVSRYGLGVAFPTPPAAFPWTTFAINVAGCLLIGALIPLVGSHPLLRPFLGTGVLGGFTTFSTYAVDFHRLVRLEQVAVAYAYLAATLISALVAAYAGGVVGRAVRGNPALLRAVRRRPALRRMLSWKG